MERVAILVAPFCVQAHTEWVSNLVRESRKSCYLPFSFEGCSFSHSNDRAFGEGCDLDGSVLCVGSHRMGFRIFFRKPTAKLQPDIFL